MLNIFILELWVKSLWCRLWHTSFMLYLISISNLSFFHFPLIFILILSVRKSWSSDLFLVWWMVPIQPYAGGSPSDETRSITWRKQQISNKCLSYQGLFSVTGTIVLQLLILYDSWIVLLVSVLHEGSNLCLIITHLFFLLFSSFLFLWNSLISEIAVVRRDMWNRKRCLREEWRCLFLSMRLESSKAINLNMKVKQLYLCFKLMEIFI